MPKTSSQSTVDSRLLMLAALKPPTTIILVGGELSHRRQQAFKLAEILVKDEDGRVQQNVHPDVICVHECDTASTANIREHMTYLGFRPYESTRTVFILEDAGRLEVAASNAMLKTLEEGGKHLVVILEVDSRDELLETVASRCYVVPFGFPPSEAAPVPNSFLSMMRMETLDTLEDLERATIEEALIECQKVLMLLCERGAADVEWATTLHAGQVFTMVKLLVQALHDFDKGLFFALILCAIDIGMRKEVLHAD